MPNAPRLSQRALWAAGQPISRLMHLALAHRELVSLAAGFVDDATLPAAEVSEAIGRLLGDARHARRALQYGTTPGHSGLREAVLSRLLAADHVTAAESPLTVDRVVVTAGSNQLLHLVADTLLDPGDIVLCASPSYFVFLGSLGNVGARAVGIETDDQGIIPQALDEELARRQRCGELDLIKAIYVVSYFDNPASITLAAERRGAIVEIAKRWSQAGRIYVIEDAAYRDLRYDGDDPPSLLSYDHEGDTVILAETFSKSFSPGVRVGWGFLPPELVAPLCEQKGNIDFGSPNFAQYVMAEVLELGLLEPHLEVLRDRYRAKRDAMVEALETSLGDLDGASWLVPDGGLYVWLALPEEIDTGSAGPLFQHALEEGVLYVPGEYCYPPAGQPARRNMARLSFGVQDADGIRRGVAALARAAQRVTVGAAKA